MFAARGGFLSQSTPASTAWNVSGAVYVDSFDVSAQGSSPQGFTFKPDGTKMYTADISNDSVNEYDLSTAWDITTASFNQTLSVSSEDNLPTDVFFKPDGTKMYLSGAGNDNIYEYDLSTAWDISTATVLQSFSILTLETTVLGMYFRDDGARMYIIGNQTGLLYSFTLSTPWDISTAFNTGGIGGAFQSENPNDVYLRPDGKRAYIVGTQNDTIYQYIVTTPWDTQTIVFQQSFVTTTQAPSPSDVAFKPDGTIMYVLDASNQTVFSYSL